MPKDNKKKAAKAKPAKAAAPATKKAPEYKAPPKEKRDTSIGNLQPKRDLTRFVRWPRYITLQRQKRVLLQRINIPPTLNQFNLTLDKEWAEKVIKFAAKYRPETKLEKKERLEKKADAIAKGETPAAEKKGHVLRYGINQVTSLVEKKEAKLVLIAHDVDPIEIVVWLPALCRKKGVPYAIIKSKSRLGQLVSKKKTTAVAITSVRSEDVAELQKLAEGISGLYNDRYDQIRKTWGGGQLGMVSKHKIAAKKKAQAGTMLN